MHFTINIQICTLSFDNPPWACSSLRAISARANSCKDLGRIKRIQENPLRIHIQKTCLIAQHKSCWKASWGANAVYCCAWMKHCPARLRLCHIHVSLVSLPSPDVSSVSEFVKIHCLQLHLLFQVFQHLLLLFFGLAWWDDEKRIKLYWDILWHIYCDILMMPKHSRHWDMIYRPTPAGSRGSALEKRGQEASEGRTAARTSKQVGSWQGKQKKKTGLKLVETSRFRKQR